MEGFCETLFPWASLLQAGSFLEEGRSKHLQMFIWMQWGLLMSSNHPDYTTEQWNLELTALVVCRCRGAARHTTRNIQLIYASVLRNFHSFREQKIAYCTQHFNKVCQFNWYFSLVKISGPRLQVPVCTYRTFYCDHFFFFFTLITEIGNQSVIVWIYTEFIWIIRKIIPQVYSVE